VAMSESPEQKQAKASLERMLALVEGWVDAVTWRAGQASLPHIARLREMMRRRRASGGPAEQTFRELMGLDLRPVEARQACAAWERVMDAQGGPAADALWHHPDTLPSLGEEQKSDHDWDAGLDELLREEGDDGKGGDGTAHPDGDMHHDDNGNTDGPSAGDDKDAGTDD
jgi:putative hydrolase